MADETSKIHIDGDWKAQAQAEKERLAEQSKSEGTATGTGTTGPAKSGELPAASFETLVSTMATQALFALGAIPDPRSGQRVAHLDLARHHIDMLNVLEAKTKGNLSEDEAHLLASTVYELRQRYIQLATSSRGPGA